MTRIVTNLASDGTLSKIFSQTSSHLGERLCEMNHATCDYKRILVPVEDLQSVEVLINFISDHRWIPDVQFKVLHVVDPIAGMMDVSGLPVLMTDCIHREGLAAGRQIVNNIARRLDLVPNKSIEALVEGGQAKEAILRYAN